MQSTTFFASEFVNAFLWIFLRIFRIQFLLHTKKQKQNSGYYSFPLKNILIYVNFHCFCQLSFHLIWTLQNNIDLNLKRFKTNVIDEPIYHWYRLTLVQLPLSYLQHSTFILIYFLKKLFFITWNQVLAGRDYLQ